MPAQDTSKTKEKMISIFKKRGPSLPVHIARETELSILFASAFLSELLSEKKLQISNMKVGSSPIYFIPEQRPMLENFSQYLKSKEKEAFILLKEKKFLKDLEQEPAIRVALRAIKDFAIPYRKNEEIFWRYFIIQEEKEIIEKPQEALPNKEVEPMPEENSTDSQELTEQKIPQSQDIEEEKKEIQISPEKKSSEMDIFDKPKAKKKEKSEFIITLLNYLEENKIKLIEETEIKKREFLGIGRVESDLGEMEILILGKDKKNINEKDLRKIVEMSIKNKRIALLLSGGEIEKKAKEFFREHKNIIKFFKI